VAIRAEEAVLMESETLGTVVLPASLGEASHVIDQGVLTELGDL